MYNQDNIPESTPITNKSQSERAVSIATMILLFLAIVTTIVGICLYFRNKRCYDENTLYGYSTPEEYYLSSDGDTEHANGGYCNLSTEWTGLINNSVEFTINLSQGDDSTSITGVLQAKGDASSIQIHGRFINSKTIRLEEHCNGNIIGAYRGTIVNGRIVGSYINYKNSEEAVFEMEPYSQNEQQPEAENYDNDGWNEDSTTPYQLVEVKPSFMGGDANQFSNWVNQHLVYPEDAKEKNIQGRVVLQFTVDRNGYVRNVKVLRGVTPSLDREAVRVVSMSPKWDPGSIDGKLVNVSYTFPIIFQLR